MTRHLFVMAIALSLGALLMGLAADRLRRRGVEPKTFLGLVAAVLIMMQLALILRLPVPSYLAWAIVASAGAATVLSYSILADYFAKELAGWTNAALNVFHVAGAFAVQYGIGLVLQCWIPEDGHYSEIAFQSAFGLNIAVQVVAWFWFGLPLGSPACLRLDGFNDCVRLRCQGYIRASRVRNWPPTPTKFHRLP